MVSHGPGVVHAALTGLGPSTTYRVFVRAVSLSQIGPWSASLLVQTSPLELRDVGLLDVGATSGMLYVASPFTATIRVLDPVTGSQVYRMDWTRAVLEVLDVATGSVVQQVTMALGGHDGLVSGGILVLWSGIHSVSLVNPLRAAAQPPALAPGWPAPTIPYGASSVLGGNYLLLGSVEGTTLAVSPAGGQRASGYVAEAMPLDGGPSVTGHSDYTVFQHCSSDGPPTESGSTRHDGFGSALHHERVRLIRDPFLQAGGIHGNVAIAQPCEHEGIR